MDSIFVPFKNIFERTHYSDDAVVVEDVVVYFFIQRYRKKSISLIIHFLMICMFPKSCTLFHHSLSARLSYNAQDATGWLSEKDHPEKTLKLFFFWLGFFQIIFHFIFFFTTTFFHLSSVSSYEWVATQSVIKNGNYEEQDDLKQER